MTIANRLITAEEFAEMTGDGLHELVRGEVVELANPGARHCDVAGEMAFVLKLHTKPRDLGKVLTNDSGYVLERNPDSTRGPDVSFIRRDRIPPNGLPKGPFPGPPDLAIEVLSPSDRVGEVDEKLEMYLAAGCPLVVLLNYERRTATLYRPGVDPHIVRGDEPLDLSAVVDGFRCALADVFG